LDGDKTYDFLVIGDPCADVSKIPMQAPELKCRDGKLEKAVRSDNGHIIIGMLHKQPLVSVVSFYEKGAMDTECKARADAGYPSGMGTIFREVAQIQSVEVERESIISNKGEVGTGVDPSTSTPTTVPTTAPTNGVLSSASKVYISRFFTLCTGGVAVLLTM